MKDRIAVVDVGTNTALLLVAEMDGGRLVPLRDERRFVRLGEGVDGARQVSDAALVRLKSVLREYCALADEDGARMACVAGTSASRDAANGSRLQAAARETCGVPYEILGGDTEAVLSFTGTVAALADVHAQATVMDVGGGSTELVRGMTGHPASIDVAYSADVGSVRITERFFGSLPPSVEDVARAQAWTDERLEPAAAGVGRTKILVGAGGTATTLAGLQYDGATTGSGWPAMERSSVIAWRERLMSMSAAEVLALDSELLFGRADVFAGGVLIVDRAMAAVGAQRLVVSPWGLRHGLALREFGLLEG